MNTCVANTWLYTRAPFVHQISNPIAELQIYKSNDSQFHSKSRMYKSYKPSFNAEYYLSICLRCTWMNWKTTKRWYGIYAIFGTTGIARLFNGHNAARTRKEHPFWFFQCNYDWIFFIMRTSGAQKNWQRYNPAFNNDWSKKKLHIQLDKIMYAPMKILASFVIQHIGI